MTTHYNYTSVCVSALITYADCLKLGAAICCHYPFGTVTNYTYVKYNRRHCSLSDAFIMHNYDIRLQYMTLVEVEHKNEWW